MKKNYILIVLSINIICNAVASSDLTPMKDDSINISSWLSVMTSVTHRCESVRKEEANLCVCKKETVSARFDFKIMCSVLAAHYKIKK